jgi:hypothetical protein
VRCATCFRLRIEPTKSGSRTSSLRTFRFAALASIFFAANLVASAQSTPFDRTSRADESAYHDFLDGSADQRTWSLLTPATSEKPDATYSRLAPRQGFRWFVTGTFGAPHLAGQVFTSACGTALDRPKEYGPHWGGAASRFGMGMAGSATSNAIEASGLIFREDPRYFRAAHKPFKARLGNVARLTLYTRDNSGGFTPAYARYAGIVGGNFLSNTWRVHSEANPQRALLRSAEGFAARLAGNAFDEFWPDLTHLFHKR